MAKGANQRLKLLYMKEIFERKSDADHRLTIDIIRQELTKQGIDVKKNDTIVQGIDDLELYVPIAQPKQRLRIDHEPRSPYYRLTDESRLFYPDEIQLLVDSVQASKFLTKEMTIRLIDKLSTLCSEFEGQKYHRSAYKQLRCTKSDSPAVHNNLALIRRAMELDCQLSFFSGHHNMEKKLVPNTHYVVSPITLLYTREFYYMLGWWTGNEATDEGEVRIFRVDRIMNPVVMTDWRRTGLEHVDEDDIQNRYTQNSFNMFHGQLREVTMLVSARLMDAVLDQFGSDIFITPVDKEHFRISPKVMVSPQFFGWVFGMNDQIEILSPEDVRQEMLHKLEEASTHHRTRTAP